MNESLPTPRQERAAERLLEDEGLTGDLRDEQARPLIRWAGEAAMGAATPERSDDELGTLLKAIRQAVRRVASEAGEVSDPDRLLALANGFLAELAPGMAVPASAAAQTVAQVPAEAQPVTAPVAQVPAEAQPAMPAHAAQPTGPRSLIETLGIRRIALFAYHVITRRS